LARSMFSLTADDSTAFNSIVGLTLVMTAQLRSRSARRHATFPMFGNLRPALGRRGSAY
jgi:hypothetical protein